MRMGAEDAERIGEQALGVGCDVSDPDAIALVSAAEDSFGPIDVFCSNAGFTDPAPGDLRQPVRAWRRIVEVNLMAHVWAAQAVVPSMLARGEGYLLQTISSAALITGPSGPGYTMTKHGALGFAEWLALNYGHRGIRVSCLCPNAVYTGMFGLLLDDESTAPPDGGALGEVLMPEDVAGTVIEAMAAERFLILPHPGSAPRSCARPPTTTPGSAGLASACRDALCCPPPWPAARRVRGPLPASARSGGSGRRCARRSRPWVTRPARLGRRAGTARSGRRDGPVR